jgi:glycosyltransferase involved in cell wall biosynthesis
MKKFKSDRQPFSPRGSDGPLLSICIATFNRRDRLLKLIHGVLDVPGAFEVCVHVDGSTDGTLEALRAISDARLVVTSGANVGKGGALLAAIKSARGAFIMPYDDDDLLYAQGLEAVLKDCSKPLPDGVVGFIYHLEDQTGLRVGGDFPVERSNFLALRADHGVTGDKKEVVRAGALREVLYDSQGRFRRVSSSLYWARLALRFDVYCRNLVIGQKIYLAGGITANISTVKRRNAYPMVLIYAAHVHGFLSRRYESLRYFLKAVLGVMYYGMYSAWWVLKRRWQATD